MLYKHLKSGRIYRLVAEAKREHDLADMAVYQHIEGGTVWIRPLSEFNDGRFEPYYGGN